jgi:hypothetical protein
MASHWAELLLHVVISVGLPQALGTFLACTSVCSEAAQVDQLWQALLKAYLHGLGRYVPVTPYCLSSASTWGWCTFKL